MSPTERFKRAAGDLAIGAACLFAAIVFVTATAMWLVDVKHQYVDGWGECE